GRAWVTRENTGPNAAAATPLTTPNPETGSPHPGRAAWSARASHAGGQAPPPRAIASAADLAEAGAGMAASPSPARAPTVRPCRASPARSRSRARVNRDSIVPTAQPRALAAPDAVRRWIYHTPDPS